VLVLEERVDVEVLDRLHDLLARCSAQLVHRRRVLREVNALACKKDVRAELRIGIRLLSKLLRGIEQLAQAARLHSKPLARQDVLGLFQDRAESGIG
jgi:hypothetical protein